MRAKTVKQYELFPFEKKPVKKPGLPQYIAPKETMYEFLQRLYKKYGNLLYTISFHSEWNNETFLKIAIPFDDNLKGQYISAQSYPQKYFGEGGVYEEDPPTMTISYKFEKPYIHRGVKKPGFFATTGYSGYEDMNLINTPVDELFGYSEFPDDKEFERVYHNYAYMTRK